MDFLDLFRYFLVLIVPGLLGALAFSLAARLRTEISWTVAFIIDLLVFVIMITGLYYFEDVRTMADLLFQFTCLSFTRKYALLGTFIAMVLGTGFGLVRRLFFWIRR